MDSRMIPSRFTQADVGEMFIVRNAGVLIPNHKYYGSEATISKNRLEACVTYCCNIFNTFTLFAATEPGAMELACVINAVQDVIVCGHSDCKVKVQSVSRLFSHLISDFISNLHFKTAVFCIAKFKV